MGSGPVLSARLLGFVVIRTLKRGEMPLDDAARSPFRPRVILSVVPFSRLVLVKKLTRKPFSSYSAVFGWSNSSST